MAQEYAGQVDFLFVYTREAHPAEKFPAHDSFEQKCDHARAMVERCGIQRRMLVDDIEGSTHLAYGGLPNMCWVISRRGRVLYKASWTDARGVEVAVQQAIWEEARRQEGLELRTYQVEMAVGRVRDAEAFLGGLADAGPRAVSEFVAAVRNSVGDGPARQIEALWEARRVAEGKPDVD